MKRLHQRFAGWAAMAWFMGAASQGPAATLMVTTTADGPPGSLRARIAEAAPGDTIGFAVTGLFPLDSELPIAKNLNISGPGVASVTLKAANSTRLLNIASGTQVSIAGLRLADGTKQGQDGGWLSSGGYGEGVPGRGEDGEGGGILNWGSLNLTECVIQNCRAIGGKGGFVGAGTSQYPQYPDGKVFDGGRALGGAIANHGLLTLVRCTVEANTATGGQGGLSDNQCGYGSLSGAEAKGGGIANFGTLRLRDCTLDQNHVTGGQGADRNGGNCSAGHGALGAGGAVWTEGTGSFVAENCSFAGNAAAGGAGGKNPPGGASIRGGGGEGRGGALAGEHALMLRSCTLSGNAAQGGQGGTTSGENGGDANGGNLSLSGATSSVLHSSILANGSATAGGPSGRPGVASGPDIRGAVTSSGNNLIRQTDGISGWMPQPSDLVAVDPLLGPLQDNGGWTHTMAPAAGSPALNAGDDAVLTFLTADQRGALRKVGAAVDIGAYEVGSYPVVNLDDAGVGSLRHAITSSVAGDTIVFVDGLAGMLRLTSGELILSGNRSIVGPASGVVVSGNNASRVFRVQAGVSASICNLTFSDGVVAGSTGGPGQPGASVQGGAVLNYGILILCNATLVNNRVFGGDGGNEIGAIGDGGDGGSASGGAVANLGTLYLINSTLATNSARGGYGGNSGGFVGSGGDGGDAFGGAVFNQGSVSVQSCTFYRNSADGGLSGDGVLWGGDDGDGQGGGCYQAGGMGGATARNCILAGGSVSGLVDRGPDVFGAVTSLGFNLVGKADDSSGWISSDLRGNTSAPLNPLLGALQKNAGPTPTMALLANSPALDAGHSGGFLTDQRGLTRPQDLWGTPNASGGDGSDIGAYELQIPVVDIGLRVRDGANTIRIAAEPAGTLTSPLRIHKNGTTYSIVLVEPADPTASRLRAKVASGQKAWARLP